MKYLICFFSGFFLFACTTANVNKSNKSEVNITSLEWRLVSVMSGSALLGAGNADVNSTLKVESDGRVHGNGGCNRFSGEAKIDGAKIKFEKVVATRMACLDSTIETALFKALNEVDSFVIESGDLMLKKGDDVIATFSSFR